MQLLKNDTVKQHEYHHSGTWGDANNNPVELQKTIWFYCFMNFLNVSIEQFKYHFSWFWYAIIKRWYSKTTWKFTPVVTWGDAEQESGGVAEKQFDLMFYEF